MRESKLSELQFVEVESFGRGFERGVGDRDESPFPNPGPLSGEYAGESVPELLGDLIDALVRLGVDESDAHEIVCDAYELGYSQGFGPVPDILSVCPDCFDWFASIAGATESPAGECPAGVSDWARPGVFVDVSGAGGSFGWYCDTCATSVGGDRYDVAVFDSGEDSAG